MVKFQGPSSCLQYGLALYFLVLPIQCASIASNATCYFPDGSVHKLGSPCRPAAGDGACCESTHACLSNGLCFDTQNNHVVRLSCTDSTWSSSACPNYCNTFAPSSIADLRQCDDNNAQWICGRNVSLCPDTTGSAKFAVSTGLINDARSTSLTKIFLQAGPTSSTVSSAATGTGKSTTTVTTTATVTAMSNSNSTTSTAGTEAAVGAGVGVPLFLALIGASWLFFRERKLRRAAEAQAAAAVPYSGPPPPVAMPTPVPEYTNYNTSLPPKVPVYQTPAYQPPAQELMMSERRAELS